MDLVFYDGAHSMKIGTKDTWEDWHLIPETKPVVAPPNVKQKQVSIPGANGMLDLTTVLTGYPTYENRTGSFSFLLAPGFWDFETACTAILNYLHGNSYRLYLKDDPKFYYQGTFTIDKLQTSASSNEIGIKYDLYPFKRSIALSTDDWLWDTFNFEIDLARTLGNVTIDGTYSFTIDDCSEPVYPIITVSSDMTITHEYERNGEVYEDEFDLETGENYPDLMIIPGSNEFTVTGSGTMSFEYRGGYL